MYSARRRTISVFVPAYNESRNLAGAVHDALAACRDFDDYEILIVNDGSLDSTGAVADQLAATLDHVRVIHHPTNRGFGAAYGTALAAARMSYFTFVPGDHEVAPESVSAIFDQVGRADLVVPYHGTPWKRPLFRRGLTWVATTQVNLLFGWHLKYYQGPAVYPTQLARVLPRTVRGFYFATEMLVHALAAGYSWVEIGLTHQERTYGRSKAVAWSNIANAQFTILRLWWDIRIRRRSNVPRAVASEPSGALEGANL
ncbi:MAG: glycosyltransferase family 2 protein [Chloroflexi bacterium]|nr:glycosyltransferase family 2 protein [Chloroflexota bacterium]MBV9598731.1 glycosyltransferase family 2 protein [Chloroflexota bacterium]